jgi:diguanylate cyclase (GGDEF)-like protein
VRILVVDDDPVSRLVLETVLRNLGHACDLAVDAQQAWARYAEDPYDVVITDRDMPGESGLGLVLKIRERPGGSYPYVILVTALDSLDQAVEGMESGADDYLLKPLDPALLRLRLIAAERVVALHHQIAEMTARLRQAAVTDPLTGLGNRLALVVDLTRMHAQASRYGHRYCVAVLDVDHFKDYNDRNGHLAGDAALQAVTQAIRTTSRGGDQVYRYGGEEFVVVLPEQDLDTATVALDRLRRAVEDLSLPAPDGGVVTISAGIAMLSQGDGQDAEQVLAAADTALYVAKRNGRNRVERAPQAGPGLRATGT